MPDLSFDIGAHDRDAITAIQALSAELTKLGGKIDELGHKDVEAKVKVKLDDAGIGGGSATGSSGGIFQAMANRGNLIAAAVAAGITFGTPLVMAAASVMFMGVAAIGLAQSETVKLAFANLGDTVKKGFRADTQSLIPVAVDVSNQLGAAFERIRPQLRQIFADLPPQIQMVTQGITGLITNTMPGLVVAIHQAGPAVEGLRSMLISIGTGLSNMFIEVSKGMPEGGGMLASLGHILESLLPLVGQLLAFASKLGGGAMPVFVSAIQMASSALGTLMSILGPIAPMIGAISAALLVGKLAWAAFSAAGSKLADLGKSVETAATAHNIMAGAAGKVGTAFEKVGNAIPYIGIAVVGLGFAYDMLRSKADEGAAAVINGSKSMADAVNEERLQIEHRNEASFLHNKAHVASASQASMQAQAEQNVTNALREQTKTMEPNAKAHAIAAIAQATYNEAMRNYGKDAPQTIAAAIALGNATAAAAEADRVGAIAKQSLIDKMHEEAAAAQLQIDAELALRGSHLAVEHAQLAVEAALKSGGAGSLAYRDATLGLDRALHGVAEAAQKKAEADAAGTSKQNIADKGTQAYMSTLVGLYSTMDGPGQASALRTISAMGTTELATLNAATAVSGLHQEVRTLPDGRAVLVTTPGAPQSAAEIQALKDKVDAVNGKKVTIDVVAALSMSQVSGGTGFGARPAPGLAKGGGIRGPGTGTSDTAGIFALSDGEHVWTDAEVQAAGGHSKVEMLRMAVLKGHIAGLSAGGRAVGSATHSYQLRGPGPYAGAQSGAPMEAAASFKQNGPDPQAMVDTQAETARQGFIKNISSWFSSVITSSGGTSGGGGGGVQQWAGVVLQALAMLGESPGLLGTTLRRMNQESGGNPTIVNLWDSNAQAGHPSVGLMQVIGPTFAANAGPFAGVGPFLYGTSVNPLANVYAAMVYARRTYGGLAAAFNVADGYKDGGVVGSPTIGMIGEDGAEAIIPLTKPDRAAQVMQQAGLGGATVSLGDIHIHKTADVDEVLNRINMLMR